MAFSIFERLSRNIKTTVSEQELKNFYSSAGKEELSLMQKYSLISISHDLISGYKVHKLNNFNEAVAEGGLDAWIRKINKKKQVEQRKRRLEEKLIKSNIDINLV